MIIIEALDTLPLDGVLLARVHLVFMPCRRSGNRHTRNVPNIAVLTVFIRVNIILGSVLDACTHVLARRLAVENHVIDNVSHRIVLTLFLFADASYNTTCMV